MLEHYYNERRSLADFRRGLLGPHFDAFASTLKSKGYAHGYAKSILGVACQFNSFLQDQKINHPSKLSDRLPETFIDLYFVNVRTPRLSWARAHKRRQLEILYDYLTEIKVFIPAKPKVVRTLYSWILDPYLEAMRQEHSLNERTIRRYSQVVGKFLKSLGKDSNHGRLKQLSATAVDAYIQNWVKQSPEDLSQLGGSLRRFFTYCAAKGFMKQDFSTLIPPVRRYRHAALPKGLEDSALNKVIGCIDRETPIGARDYAIMLLLMGYGIRGVSAAELLLDDIDWRQSQIRIRAQKAGKEVVLPLLDAVGAALVDYLRHRPRNSLHREVFLTTRAPFRPLDSMAISAVSRRHILRAGVHIEGGGTRSFRHSWAIRALAHDSPIKAIADVLGHRYIDTTFIYAKADLKTLQGVAMPWPEKR